MNQALSAYVVEELSIEHIELADVSDEALLPWYQVDKHVTELGGFCGISMDYMDSLTDAARAKDMSVGSHHISETLVIKDIKGWYIGDICITRGSLLEYYPQPWTRHSSYMSRDNAVSHYLACYQQDAPVPF